MIEDLLRSLSGNGPLGLVAALAFWTCHMLYKRLAQCQDQRVADTERVVTAIFASTEAVKANTEALRDLVRQRQKE